MQCANNLKQIGLAIHHFHETQGKLPPLALIEHHATWAVFLLPYLEHQSIYDEWDLTRCYYDQPEEVRQRVVATYICPSRARGGGERFTRDVPDAVHPRHGKDEYPGAIGDYVPTSGQELFQGSTHVDGMDGAIICAKVPDVYAEIMESWTSRTSFSSVYDGLSTTFLVGEKSYCMRERISIWNGDHCGNSLGPVRPIERVRPASCDIYGQPWGFGSAHPGICQFLMGDGSVQAISVSTSGSVLGALVTRAGGEVISSEVFQ